MHSDGVQDGKRQVGRITSTTHAPALGCAIAIAMARAASEWSDDHNRHEVGKLIGHMKRLVATVCSVPVVDPQRVHPRA